MANTAAPRIKKPRVPSPRYGIAEWFGRNMTTLTPEERQRFGHLAARQTQDGTPYKAPICPFLSALIPGAPCSKAGGVCTIRKYATNGTVVAGDKVVTVCPFRFLQSVEPKKSLFVWIAETMLDISNPIIVKETPFLKKLPLMQRDPALEKDTKAKAKEEKKRAGRIDWILVNPASLTSSELEWCAVETQALYFSGGKMRPEFDAYAHAPSPVIYPAGNRRPDYRSSGPKRLWPQLDVKVPVLRAWGKKVVVVIDRFFFENMNTLTDALPRAESNQERRDNAEIAWFVVEYDETLSLKTHKVVLTSLESSRTALNATEPLSKQAFTQNLKSVMTDVSRINKVFKASQ